MTALIVGAGGSGGGKGGGGGGARTPTTARDSLDSRQYAEVIDLVSEGEIEGLKDGFKSIFLDNTPLQNPDGSFNFQNVTVYTRNGTQSQDAIPFATAIQDERPVNVTVRNDGPVTRTITDSQTDAVRITINVPRLERITNEGDTVGESFRLQVQVQYNGGGFSAAIDDTISGRTGDPYQRQYLIPLAAAFPVDIRLVRITGDSNDVPYPTPLTGAVTPKSSTAAWPTRTAPWSASASTLSSSTAFRSAATYCAASKCASPVMPRSIRLMAA